jgi:hypothetical protein
MSRYLALSQRIPSHVSTLPGLFQALPQCYITKEVRRIRSTM